MEHCRFALISEIIISMHIFSVSLQFEFEFYQELLLEKFVMFVCMPMMDQRVQNYGTTMESHKQCQFASVKSQFQTRCDGLLLKLIKSGKLCFIGKYYDENV